MFKLSFPSDKHDSSINRLPNEVLAHILKIYMCDYFELSAPLKTSHPPPLCVCRHWRGLITSTPGCWTRMNVIISTEKKMKYARSRFTSRDTKTKAIQDNLRRYFEYAKDCPVDFSVCYSDHFSNDVRHALIYWLSNSMPKLRKYKEIGPGRGIFLSILGHIPEDNLASLTELCIADSGYLPDLNSSDPVSLPNLRVLRMNFRILPSDTMKFLALLEAPILRGFIRQSRAKRHCVEGDFAEISLVDGVGDRLRRRLS